VAYTRVQVDAGCLAHALRRRAADAVDVGERDLQPLLAGDVDAGDTSHGLPLPLLVPRVRADDLDPAVAADHLALLADPLDAGTNLHGCLHVAIGDATSAEVVGRELHLDAVTGQDADVVHEHLPGA